MACGEHDLRLVRFLGGTALTRKVNEDYRQHVLAVLGAEPAGHAWRPPTTDRSVYWVAAQREIDQAQQLVSSAKTSNDIDRALQSVQRALDVARRTRQDKQAVLTLEKRVEKLKLKAASKSVELIRNDQTTRFQPTSSAFAGVPLDKLSRHSLGTPTIRPSGTKSRSVVAQVPNFLGPDQLAPRINGHTCRSATDFAVRLSRSLKIAEARLTAEDRAAIHYYTSETWSAHNTSATQYRYANDILRGGPISNIEKVAADLHNFSAALAKLPSFSGIVYRGLHLSSEGVDRYKVDGVNVENNYTSTSLDPSRAFAGNVLMVIEAKDARVVDRFSANGDEGEVILDHFARLSIKDRYFDPHRVDPGTGRPGVWVIQAEQL